MFSHTHAHAHIDTCRPHTHLCRKIDIAASWHIYDEVTFSYMRYEQTFTVG